MANSDKDIKITPNTNQSGYPTIEFVGSSSAPIVLEILDDNSLSFTGSEGQLFSINNNLTVGTIFSVNDVSGIPSIEVDADGTVSLAEFGGNVGIGTSSPTHKLEVVGHLSASVISASTYVGISAGDVTQAGDNTFTGTNTFNTNFVTASAGITGSVAYLGQIGIGTTSPGELLDVRTTTATAGQGARIGEAKIGTWEGSTSWAAFTHNSVHSTTTSYALMQDNSGRTLLNAASGQSLEFRINNGTKMFIGSTGQIGVNTSSPAYQLDVNGSTNIFPTALSHSLYLERNSGYSSIRATDAYLIMDSNTNFAAINYYVAQDVVLNFGGGNTGIGTNTPSEKLDVNGIARADNFERAAFDEAWVSDLTKTYDAATYGIFRLYGAFSGAMTINVNNLQTGRTVLIYVRNTATGSRTVNVNASSTTSGHQSIAFSNNGGISRTSVSLAAAGGTAVFWVANANAAGFIGGIF